MTEIKDLIQIISWSRTFLANDIVPLELKFLTTFLITSKTWLIR